MTGDRTSRIAGWLAAIAFVFALTLSVTPQLHERLHNSSDRVTHHCAATLVSSGNCDHVAAASLQCAPDLLPAGPAIAARDVQTVTHAVDSALLEHAPPSLS